MKEISILILIIVLVGFAGTAAATSPMPSEEILGLQVQTVCTVHIVYIPAKGAVTEEISSPLTFDASIPKKEVLDKVTRYISDKFNEVNASEFSAECRVAKQ